jgi:hypothetical protein
MISEGDRRCLLCRKPFVNNVSIYCGVTGNNAIVVVGDCCIDRMKAVYAVGVAKYRADFESQLDE